jgi:hypothetical protein
MTRSRLPVATLSLALTALGLCAALLAPSAEGGTISREDVDLDTRGQETRAQVFEYRARRGERNRVAVRLSATGLAISDRTGVRAGSGCRRRSRTRAFCPYGDLTPVAFQAVAVALGNGSDRATLRGASPRDLDVDVSGGSGNDRLRDALSATNGPATYVEDTAITGGPGNDRLVGGGASNVFESSDRDGRDTMLGGRGRDVVSYSGRSRGVRADLQGDPDDGQRGERDRIGRDVEDLEGGRGNDRLGGNRAVNILEGGDGRDRLDGGRQRDLLLGDDGADRLIARDDRPDVAACGTGRDVAVLDGKDLPSLDEGEPGVRGDEQRCERIDRRGAPAAVLDFDTLTPQAFVRPTFSLFDRRVEGVFVACPADAAGPCSGQVRVAAAGEESGTSYTVAAGQSGSVTVTVSPRVDAANSAGPLRALLSVDTARGSGAASSVAYGAVLE